MRSFVFILLISVASPLWAARQIIGSEQDHSLAGEATDCESFYKTTFTNFRAQMHDQEQREISLTGVDQLKVIASEEGGVSIRGWNRPTARLVVCRYAVAHNKSQALRLLGNITVDYENGQIAATGPRIDDTQAWWVNMTLYVPRRASVDVRAESGGVAIRNMSGSVTAHATSGGISLARSSGRYKISTASGGITIDRVTGQIDATSRDGAIALRLPGADFPSVEAIAAGNEILCTLDGCDTNRVHWSANRRLLRIGEGTPEIRLSTTAAPIIIQPVTF